MADIIDIKTARRIAPNSRIETNKKDFTVLNLDAVGIGSNYEFNASEATRNILVLGQTGSGKSTSVILPAIQSFIQNDCPGLVLDIKADLYSAIHAIARKENKLANVTFIGVHDFCEDMNILASIKTIEQLKNVLTSVKPYSDTQHSQWFYWGLMDVLDVVTVDKWYSEEILKKEYKFDFRIINGFINDPATAKSIIDKAESEIDFASIEIASTIRKIKREPFSLYPNHNDEDTDTSQQRMWRSGQISNILTPLIKEPFYSKLFNRSNSKSLHDYIYKDGKMLVLTVPLEHESTGYVVSKLLREVYFKAVCQNEIEDLDAYRIGAKFNRYTTLVIDEYQFYLNTEQQNGVITDDNWLSISRGYSNINLFATQSISSMYSKSSNLYAVNTIVQNFANKIFLASSDPATCEHARFLTKDFVGGDLVPDFMESVLLSPAAGKRVGMFRVSNDGGICFDSFNYGINPTSQYMNSDDFKKLKQESAGELKAKAIKPVIEETTYQIIASTEKSITTTNGTKKRITEFETTRLFTDIHTALISAKPKSLHHHILARKYILTPYNITFSENTAEAVKVIAGKLKDHHSVRTPTVMDYMEELNKAISEIDLQEMEIIENEHSTAQEIRDQYTIAQHQQKDTASNLIAEKMSAIKKSHECDLNIVVITHNGSLGYEDFKSKIAETRLAKISIQDYEKSLNDPEFRKTKEGASVFKKLKWADAVCFIRGGGDLSHSSFRYYRNVGLVPCVKKINPNCTVITALGHAPNVFLADLFADHSFITPTDAAQFLNDFVARYSETLYSINCSSVLADEITSKQTESNATMVVPTKPTFKKKILNLFGRS